MMRPRYAGRVEWDAADYWMSFVNSAGMNANTRSSSSVADAAGRERGGSSGAEQNRTMAQRSARCSNRSGSAASNRAGSVCNRRWHSGYGIMNGSMGQWNLLTQQSARTRPAAATKRKKKRTDLSSISFGNRGEFSGVCTPEFSSCTGNGNGQTQSRFIQAVPIVSSEARLHA